jgi:Flp pilus assembly protein TadG
MMARRPFLRDSSANAAVEMALVTPILMAVLFGSVEMGNYFMSEHAVEKAVRDGARYAARLPLAAAYSCPNTVFADAGATNNIINVTKTGAVSGPGFPRLPAAYWNRTCGSDTQTVTVSIACVNKADIDTENTGNTGIYTGLNGTIPVVTVSARVKYQSVLGELGFHATNLCLSAESNAALQGL